MKDVMTGLEKVWSVVSTIKDAKDITASSLPCLITDSDFDEAVRIDVEYILHKLAEDDKILTFKSSTETTGVINQWGEQSEYELYEIRLTPLFDRYYATVAGQHIGRHIHTGGESIEYDEELASIRLGPAIVTLPSPSSLEAFLFKQVYQANGRPLGTETLVSDYSFLMHQEPSDRSLKDARRRVNKKMAAGFGFVEAIKYSDEQFWLDPELSVRDSLHSL